MKKQKALEDMTHQDLIEALIYDENIQDNLYVSDDYAPDKHGNNLITIGFEETGKKKRGPAGFILLTFNSKGRMVSMEVAIRKNGREWIIASSEKLVDFTARFGNDILKSVREKKKNGN